MKKTISVLTLMLLLMMFSGCVKKEESGGVVEKKSESGAIQRESEEKRGDVFGMDEVAEMMGMGKSMKCVYKVKDGDEVEFVTYVSGKKYKTENTMNNMKYHGIFDGTDMYSWIEGQKNGTKMNMECMKGLGDDFKTNTEGEQPSDIEEDPIELLDDKVDVKCTEVGNIDFSVPSDVVFTDQCAMMREQMEALRKNMENLPKF